MGMSKTCILIGVMEAMSSEVGHIFDLFLLLDVGATRGPHLTTKNTLR